MEKVIYILLFFCVLLFVSLVFGLIIMLIWNNLLAPIFEIQKQLTFIQSWVLSLLWAFLINVLKSGFKAEVKIRR